MVLKPNFPTNYTQLFVYIVSSVLTQEQEEHIKSVEQKARQYCSGRSFEDERPIRLIVCTSKFNNIDDIENIEDKMFDYIQLDKQYFYTSYPSIAARIKAQIERRKKYENQGF